MPAATNKTHKAAVPLPSPEADEPKSASIPLVSVVDDASEMRMATDFLLEADELRKRVKADTERLDEIKLALCEMSEAYGTHGLRYGNIALQYSGWSTKKTLDKRLLLENGVDPEVLKECYVESKPFRSARFIEVK